jgi:hypothetical protein
MIPHLQVLTQRKQRKQRQAWISQAVLCFLCFLCVPSLFADSVSEGVAKPPSVIDFLREAPLRKLFSRKVLAPTEGRCQLY